jgi:hypothetical protein
LSTSQMAPLRLHRAQATVKEILLVVFDLQQGT